MVQKRIALAETGWVADRVPVSGTFIKLDETDWYKIEHYDQMPPFFLTVVSDSDHWMFLSSNGALTAGRRNPEHALFPYTTDDKIHDSLGISGSHTSILVERGELWRLWEPFTPDSNRVYQVQRNLYKSVLGNQIRFEEINRDLELSYSYTWSNSERFGFVRESTLTSLSTSTIRLSVLDGLLNLLPAGVDRQLQANSSTLLDAYKKNELDPETGLGLYLLSSVPVDRPEPSESLQATTVWSTGLPDPLYLLCDRQLHPFRDGQSLQQEVDVRAHRGAFLVNATRSLEGQQRWSWSQVADIDQGSAKVADLRAALRDKEDLWKQVQHDIARGHASLARLVACADGSQSTRERSYAARHHANVLFNIMRGGIFADGYQFPSSDLVESIREHDLPIAEQHAELLGGLPEIIQLNELLQTIEAQSDRQLERLCYEYLPLSFSRRHGDPSRPWNHFSIELKRGDGGRSRFYQGNWRDIFQNWEALCRSFPAFSESVVTKFLNASTADGYNPYRISRKGIDWEVPDPHDPWAYIGYWGDHQIIYLLRLLESCRDHDPERLPRLLNRKRFAYANVPYRLHGHDQILADPYQTIDFDETLAARIQQRVDSLGADGKLLIGQDGKVLQVPLIEKLLVTLLAKLTNLAPQAGIWMNTQRPEWNDANNALVGHGASIVTACYLRRYVEFLGGILRQDESDAYEVSTEVTSWLRQISLVLRRDEWTSIPMTAVGRLTLLDELGRAGSRYRQQIYGSGFSESTASVSRSELIDFLSDCRIRLDQTIEANQREDGLFHAYNLLSWPDGGGLRIRHLYEMLEGQVAVLSSGYLSIEQSLQVLDALRHSALYRMDQQSYLLYPDRQLPRFLDKNQIPKKWVERSQLLTALIADRDERLVTVDGDGNCHFSPPLRNASDVRKVLDELERAEFGTAVRAERDTVLELWETMFDHHSYTGRSGTFFGYEGLGCIYWHMVSKLLLAVGELFLRGKDEEVDPGLLERLARHYDEIRFGLGATKDPAAYGAFPFEPYSHTPGNAGVQQPGMTGQVKEDILSRWNELGIRVKDGRVSLEPAFVRRDEFVSQPTQFRYFDSQLHATDLAVPANALAFTYCQTPIRYRLSANRRITVSYQDGSEATTEGLRLTTSDSRHLFSRDGWIRMIEVEFPEQECRP